jgi:hypothetical protein
MQGMGQQPQGKKQMEEVTEMSPEEQEAMAKAMSDDAAAVKLLADREAAQKAEMRRVTGANIWESLYTGSLVRIAASLAGATTMREDIPRLASEIAERVADVGIARVAAHTESVMAEIDEIRKGPKLDG